MLGAQCLLLMQVRTKPPAPPHTLPSVVWIPGGDNSHLHQSLLTKREGAGVVEATGPQQEEEELAKLDRESLSQGWGLVPR